MRVLRYILTVLLALAFLATGVQKVTATATVAQQLGLPSTLTAAIGVLELAGAAGLLAGFRFLRLGTAAALGLTLLMLGAIGHHLLNGGSPLMALVLGVLSGVNLFAHLRGQSKTTELTTA